MARHKTAEQIEALRKQQKDLADKLKEALKKAAIDEKKLRAKRRGQRAKSFSMNLKPTRTERSLRRFAMWRKSG